MNDTVIVFSKYWTKLDQPMFTTLRKSKFAKEGEKVKIYNKPNVDVFPALCLLVVKFPLGKLSTVLLCIDTDTRTREAAISKIQQFYRTPLTDDTVFYLHLFQKEVPNK